MPQITVNLESSVTDSFRVQQVAGLFDLSVEERSRRSWQVELPSLEEHWQIGAIVGPSGAGKSVIARQWAKDLGIARPVERYDWPKDASILDGFPEDLPGGIKAITGILNSVGFSSPPAWVLPYRCLSNGQQFRADLARALLTPGKVVLFDEFTSVVDRQVARFGSAAVAKTIRKGRTEAAGGPSRFVAVTCHHDILDWLQPDWVLDLGAGAQLARGWLQQSSGRPDIKLDICLAHRSAWPTFAHHHYLNHRLHRSAWCYMAWWEDRPVAFLATLNSTGKSRARMAHRLVVLPDFQGLGVGTALLEQVAAYELATKTDRFSLITSHPALIAGLRNNPRWRCRSVNKCNDMNKGLIARPGGYMKNAFAAMARFRVAFESQPAA